MKICFMTHSVFNLGGVQRVVSVVANSLSKYHDITILCLDNNFPVNREIYNLYRDIKIEMSLNILSSDNLFEKIFYKSVRFINGRLNFNLNKNLLFNSYYNYDKNKLIDFFNKNKFDIIIGVEGDCSLMLANIASEITAKTIGWQHNSYDAYLKNPNKYYWKQNEIFKEYIPKLDKYFVLNEYDKKMYKQEMNINCNVMENPVSFESKEKSKLTKKNFLAAGRFTKQKGFDLLVESFREFSKINEEWTLTLVGEGEDEDLIRELVNQYRLEDRIKINPFTNDIKEYFFNSSALLLSSRWEGMPMIALEALVIGVPIISYDITAIHPIVTNGDEGIIIEKFNVKEFAKSMQKISNSYELRREMGKKAIIKSQKFNIQFITNKWNEYLEKI